MKRRNFILGGGLLASLSLGATATNASLADTVAAAADFRVLAEPTTETDTSFDANPITENTLSEHTWEIEVSTELDIVEITADYEFDEDGASFDQVADGDVDIEFFDNTGGNPGFDSVGFTGTYEDAIATFDLDGDDIDGEAIITIDNIENPGSGTYDPTLTFVAENDASETFEAELLIPSGEGEFELSNVSVSPTGEVGVGNNLTAEFEVTNVGDGTDSVSVGVFIDRGDGFVQEESSGFELDPEETASSSISYGVESKDRDQIEVQVAADDDSEEFGPIDVIGGWDLEVDGDVHVWSTEGFEFSEDIDTITVEYPSSGQRGSQLNFDRGGPDTTITFDGTEENFNEEVRDNGYTAEWDLTNDPSVAFPIEIELDGHNEPDPGEYEADLTIEGVDGETSTTTQSFTI